MLDVLDLLRPWVADVTVATLDDDGPGVTVDLPDTATTLIVRVGTDGRRDVMVAGPRTRALYHRVGGPGPTCLQLRLRPGGARLLVDRPVHDLVDRLVPVADLEIPAAPRTPDDDLVEAATGLLASSGVGATARSLGVSERQLRKLFTRDVGLSPKHFARIDRVRTVLATPDDDLADVAARSGYYDQSHMTTEFRRLMGVPPAAFNAGRLPSPSPCRSLDG